jgi:protein-L-isoaspartate(D-aspartate) O-methyltransferase
MTSEETLDKFLSESRISLVHSLKAEGILKTGNIEEALLNVRREDFLWPGTPKSLAYLDEPISLNETGQTISAPHMITMMLEKFELWPGLKVLEIGSGSGYNAALITYIVTKSASDLFVTSIERNSSLAEFARNNIERAGFSKYCIVIEGDGSLGYPEQSDKEIYDRIIVTAGAPRVPVFLKKQLKIGGIMEIPVGGSGYQVLTILRKNSRREFEQQRSVDCVFVPLVGSDANPD